LQGYILLKLNRELSETELWDLVKRYEAVEGVDFCAHVIGSYDFVLTVDTKRSLDGVARVIGETGTCTEVLSLKVNNSFVKHRELKDLKILEDLNLA
jgi:hypothetical protein